MSGKVKFDDAEPAVNVAVQLYRSYSIADATVMPQPQARAPTIAASTACMAWNRARITSQLCTRRRRARPAPKSSAPRIRSGNPLPELSYAVTFFPEAQRMSDAVPLKIGARRRSGRYRYFPDVGSHRARPWARDRRG